MRRKEEFERILTEAHEAASAAQADMVEDMNALDCGFAWVSLPGNEPLAAYCRGMARQLLPQPPSYADRKRYGSKGYPKGWQWWGPGSFNGQSISIHEAGARGFRDALARHNISATVGSRYD